MQARPQKEHDWLQQLVGDWTVEMSCQMGPGQPPVTSTGQESVHSLGGLWTIGEGTGQGPDGAPVSSVMTLGFDPGKGRYVGTFIASIMTQLWRYEGSLDAASKVLTLDTEGPSMSGDGSLAKYQDVLTVLSPDHRMLTSRLLGEDGNWTEFMTAHYRRKT